MGVGDLSVTSPLNFLLPHSGPIVLMKEKETSICGVQALCQVFHEQYLIKSSQPPSETVLISLHVRAEEVEAQRLRSLVRITSCYLTFHSEFHTLSLYQECLGGGVCTAVSLADIINRNNL